MQLSKKTLVETNEHAAVSLPAASQFQLPEKVLQFGTGVLLRGLPDYFIDKANKAGVFNGRIVVVKSTATGGADAFAAQDGLYTQCIKGISNGAAITEYIVNSSVSRVLAANRQWADILEFAQSPDLKLIISNTTELGIVLSNDNITDAPPASFPGKLLAVLYQRFKAFNGSADSGLVIVPTELIIDNATKLKAIVLELAEANQLENSFIDWINHHNDFCNSLVDRIVPGKLEAADKKDAEDLLGYEDELMIMSEVFRLWAIQSNNEKVKEVLSFAQVDDGVIIAPDIEKFRELKLRLLNGTHTFCCGLAHLAGFTTVKEAMADADFNSFAEKLVYKELAPAVSGDLISHEEAQLFAKSVLERFSNPFLEHKWLAIAFAYTSKMLMRNIPLIKAYYNKHETGAATAISLGFAAYILFMKTNKNGNDYEGTVNNVSYILNDDKAHILFEKWETKKDIVNDVLSDTSLWNEDLTQLTNFAEHVQQQLQLLMNDGAKAALQKLH